MTLTLDANAALRLRLLGRVSCLGAVALIVAAALAPQPAPAPPQADRPDPLVAQALASVEETLKTAQEAARKAAVPVENWSSLGPALAKIRKPPKPAVAKASPPAGNPAKTAAASTATPKGPQPATTNPILSTWRYLGPIVVGKSKYAVLSIRDKQVLLAQGESSQQFRIVDILPHKIVVKKEGDDSTFEVALAKPRTPSASPVAPGARSAPGGGARGTLPVFQRTPAATGASPPPQDAIRRGRQP